MPKKSTKKKEVVVRNKVCKSCGQELPSKKLKRYNQILHEITDCCDGAFHGVVIMVMLDYLAEQIELALNPKTK